MDRPGQPARTAAADSGNEIPFIEFVRGVLDDKRAEDVVRLDVSEITSIADEFLIATITSGPQGSAIVETCEKERKRRGLTRIGVEGEGGSSWILLDYGDFIVHLLMPEAREYYGLEHLWADAKRVE